MAESLARPRGPEARLARMLTPEDRRRRRALAGTASLRVQRPTPSAEIGLPMSSPPWEKQLLVDMAAVALWLVQRGLLISAGYRDAEAEMPLGKRGSSDIVAEEGALRPTPHVSSGGLVGLFTLTHQRGIDEGAVAGSLGCLSRHIRNEDIAAGAEIAPQAAGGDDLVEPGMNFGNKRRCPAGMFQSQW